MSSTPVGLTKDAGWQIGVSRTLPLPPAEAWERLLSPEGIATWLGEGAELRPERGAPYETRDGVRGEVRSLRPEDRVRITWQPPGRDEPATVQVAITPAASGTTVRFHTEHLANAAERERMREHWQDVLDRLEAAFAT